MIRASNLHDQLTQYSLYRRLKPTTEYQMGRAIALFGEWLGHVATLEDLADELASRWLRAIEQTHSQRTVAGHRTNLLVLWRDCADRGLCEPPRRVRHVPRPEPCPIAWTREEVCALVARCEQLVGAFPNGVSRRDYAMAIVHVAYDTGLRRSDLWTLRRQSVRPDGTVIVRQQKTSRVHYPRMRPATVRRFELLPGDPPLRCPYRSESAFYRWWRRDVIVPAGVRHGSLQQTRRTGATHLAVEHRDSVQQYLGHATPSMQRHYVDRSIAEPPRHLPPAIGD